MPKNSSTGRSSGAGRWSRMKVSTCAVRSAIARLPAEGAASLPRMNHQGTKAPSPITSWRLGDSVVRSSLDLVHIRAGGALLEVGGGDRAQAAGVVVADRLDDLVARIHHEGAVEDHRLVDRLAAEQQHFEAGRAARLRRVRRHGDGVAGAEDGQLALAQRRLLLAGAAAAGEHVDERVEVRPPGEL